MRAQEAANEKMQLAREAAHEQMQRELQAERRRRVAPLVSYTWTVTRPGLSDAGCAAIALSFIAPILLLVVVPVVLALDALGITREKTEYSEWACGACSAQLFALTHEFCPRCDCTLKGVEKRRGRPNRL
jgi:hypothetical protein